MALVPLRSAKEDAPTAGKIAIGIDLGTTNSLVATVGEDANAVILAATGEARLLPSAVHYAADGTKAVGDGALLKRQEDPQNVITSAKRLMGRGGADVQGAYRYDYLPTEGMVRIRTAGGDKSPVEVSADILRALRDRAFAALAVDRVDGAVITVPAYFDDAQRQATKDAAQLAGLPVLRLLNEPTAAAVAYGLDRDEEGVYVVYDLGGGTFDLSVLRLRQGVFQVLATGGNTALGGDDYDRALARLAGDTEVSDADGLRLLAAAKTAKEAWDGKSAIPLRAVLSTGERGAEIGADAFLAAIAPLTEATLSVCGATLRDAGVDRADIRGVIMVGGGTRLSAVRDAVAEFFQRPLYANLNPEEVVALGAAAQADILAGNRRGKDWLLLDVTPLSLGLETMGGLAEKIIHRNSPVPTEKSREFTTFRDGQTAMRIHVVQGERELVSDCRSLATFTLSGIPPMAAGTARIQVCFRIDADGLLSVTATEASTGTAAGIEVKPAYGLSADDFSVMLKEAYTHAQDDWQARQLAELKRDGDELVRQLGGAMETDAALLSDEERRRLERQAAELSSLMQGEDYDAIKACYEGLREGSVEFATRRMNAEIAKVVVGKRPQDL